MNAGRSRILDLDQELTVPEMTASLILTRFIRSQSVGVAVVAAAGLLGGGIGAPARILATAGSAVLLALARQTRPCQPCAR